MPTNLSVTLNALADTSSSCKSNPRLALTKLAESANGPLRLKKKFEKGVVVRYLGVRSWPTYFFEKLLATDEQKANARRKTMVAIEKYVRPFLNEHDVATGSALSAEQLTERLFSSVTRQPLTGKEIGTSEPYFRSREKFISTPGKFFHGISRVPTGLSFSVGDPLRMIADVHLVRKTGPESYLMGDLKQGRIVEQTKFPKIDQMSDFEFEHQYLSMLNNEKGSIQTSVVLELQLDTNGLCSEANLEGARCAAEKFLLSQNHTKKNISIMLIVPALPSSVAGSGSSANADDIEGKTSGNNADQEVMIPHDSENDSSSEESSY